MKTIVVIALLAVFAAASEGSKGSLSGRVVDENGKALAGARVHAEASGGGADATSDEKGAFNLELEPGTYRLTVSAEGYTEFEVPDAVSVESGKQKRIKEKIELQALDQGSVVRGSVFSDTGRSLAGAKVVLERDSSEGRSLKLESRTDQMGLFTFKVPKGAGRYRVTASREGFAPGSRTVEVSGGELTNIAIKLSPGSDRP
jgi:uncharacterized membrane protein